jgi:hypothetical protein
MVEQILWRFLEYRKRKQAVIIATMVTGLVAVWPAADEYIAARSRYSDARSELEETERQIENLPKFTQLLEKRKLELANLEKQTFSQDAAQTLRSELQQMIRETDCQMRNVRLGDPISRDWTTNDDPVTLVNMADRGTSTPFQLVTRQMSLQITGTMPNLSRFLERLSKLNGLVHTKSISLRRTSQQSTNTSLDMEILLFDLARRPA